MPDQKFIWQDYTLLEDRKHTGGWAIIMYARRMLRCADYRGYTDENVENIISKREETLDRHGEPPRYFVEVWLIDEFLCHRSLAKDLESVSAKYDAHTARVTREMWRELFGDLSMVNAMHEIKAGYGRS